MKSQPVAAGDAGTHDQYNNLRKDAYGGSLLLAHQQATLGMTLYVEPGTYYIGATRVLFAGGNTPSFTAPTSHPRIDIVTADSSGTIAITQGTESVSPSAPAYPTNKVVICEVYNVVGETALYDNDSQTSGQGYISNDVRMILQPVYIGSATQVATGLFIPWIPSVAQGDVPYYSGTAWARLPAGASGGFLQTQGPGAAPQWASSILNVASGTDSLSGTTPVSTTHTITHGLPTTPKLIMFSASFTVPVNNSGVGSATLTITGWASVNSSNASVGGFQTVLSNSSGNLTGATSAISSISGSTSGSTWGVSMSISLTAIGSTSFGISYSATRSDGGSTSVNFGTVTWMAMC